MRRLPASIVVLILAGTLVAAAESRNPRPPATRPVAKTRPSVFCATGLDEIPLTTGEGPDPALALAKRCGGVRLADTPLADSLQFLRDITGVVLVVDWDALAAAGVHRDTRVTYDAPDVDMRQVFADVLAACDPEAHRLEARPLGRILLISTGEGFTAVAKIDAEIVAAGRTAPKLQELLNRTVEGLWMTDGHLATAIDRLRAAAGADVEVDWPAFARAGSTRDMRVDLEVRRVTMGRALQLVIMKACGNCAVGHVTVRGDHIVVSADRAVVPTTHPSVRGK